MIKLTGISVENIYNYEQNWSYPSEFWGHLSYKRMTDWWYLSITLIPLVIIRINFSLLYEIIAEMCIFGPVQNYS